MVEIVSNIIQIGVLCVCAVVSIYFAGTRQSREWLLFGLFSGSFLLGDLWWLLCLIFYGWDYGYSLIPYINWKASILFLILLLLQYHPVGRKPVHGAQRLIPVACGLMCVFYMQYGAYVDNVITALFMSITIWIIVQRLLQIKKGEEGGAADRCLCLSALFFCVMEYALWTASCLDYDNPLRHLYEVFGFILTFSVVLFLPAIRKVVRR